MKKFLIASGVAVFGFASLVAAQGYVFNNNLTVGSTGADVVALQTALISAGFDIPAISSGAAAKGYFGSQTQDAVKAYQLAKNIANPPTGFVGPLTRNVLNAGGTTATPGTGSSCAVGLAAVNYMGTSYCLPAPLAALFGAMNPGSTPGTPTTGVTEGSLDLTGGTLGDVENEVDEGATEKVYGFELKAKDSNMKIERVDVLFALSGTGSSRLDRYIDEVSIWLGSTKLATLDVSAGTRDGDETDFRFSGLNGSIVKDQVGELYVAVKAKGNVDTGDINKNITVSIPSNGLRAVDSVGISETYSPSGSEVFNIVEEEAGELEITEADGNPAAGIITLSETSQTNEKTILVIELEANDADVMVTDFPIGLSVTGADQVSDLVQRVMLKRGSETLKTKTISSTGGTYRSVVFDGIDFTVDGDSTEEFSVVVDLKATTTSATTLTASTTKDLAWDVEDATGEALTGSSGITGDAQGNTMTFYNTGMTVSVLGTPTATKNPILDGSADSAEFKINFTVVNNGSEDIWIDGAVAQGVPVPTTSTAGLAWATSTQSNTGTSTVSAVFQGVANSSNSLANDASSDYRVRKGTSRVFEFVVTVPTGIPNGNIGVAITGIKWGTAAGTTANLYNFSLENLATPTVTGLQLR